MDNQKIDIKLNKKESVYIFTDFVKIETYDPEIVRLDLAIKDSPNSATVHHTVLLTIPHFIRFADVCGNLSNEIKKKLTEINKHQK